jgi:hypothetical protein
MELGKETSDLSAETDRYWKTSLGRRAADKNMTPEALQKQDLEEAADKLREAVAKFDELRADEILDRLKSTDFSTSQGACKIQDAAARKKILIEAVKTLELKDKVAVKLLEGVIATACDEAMQSLFMGLSGLKPESDSNNGLVLPKEFDAQFKAHCQSAGKVLATTLNAAFAEAVSDKVDYAWNNDGSVPTPFDGGTINALLGASKLWDGAVQAAADNKKGGWVKSDKAAKVSLKIVEFGKKTYVVRRMLLANDKGLKQQGEWRAATASLHSALAGLPCLTKYKTTHRGMTDYVARCQAAIGGIEERMEPLIRQVNETTDWLPPVAFFDTLILMAVNHTDVVNLCKSRHLDESTVPSNITVLFTTHDNAKKEWQKVDHKPRDFTKSQADTRVQAYRTALENLRDEIAKVQPKYGKTHPRVGALHDGMDAYVKSVVQRIGTTAGGEIKDLLDHHQVNATKYKA